MRKRTGCAILTSLFAVALLNLSAHVAQAMGPDLPSPLYSPGEPGVVAPRLIHRVKAKYSPEALKLRYEGGVCEVRLIVNAEGKPEHIYVFMPLGMHLDENAVPAVRQYRFKPGKFHGKPVAVKISLEVSFRPPQTRRPVP